MSQFTAVKGSAYLGKGKVDPQLGRVEGNGQNWIELLTTKTDPGQNTINLRGYQIEWSYDDGSGSSGKGTMTFSNDPVWAKVPLGTAITISEYQKAWYLINTPEFLPDGTTANPDWDGYPPNTGMQFDGGIDGLGNLHGTPYSGDTSVEKLLDFSSNVAWNPHAVAGANMPAGTNWNINVWAGQQTGGQYQYFTFDGKITKNGTQYDIGTPDAGLFSVNNDNWQFTIRDRQNNVVEGPIGESVSGWGLGANKAGKIGSDELGRLEDSSLQVGNNPTLSTWQHVGIAQYADGTSSNFGGPSVWTDANSMTVSADLSPLRNWFSDIKLGDVNLDGIVNASDIAIVASNWLRTGGGWLSGDIDGNGIVNAGDIAVISGHWLAFGGAPSIETSTAAGPGAVPIPEPASGILCAIGAFFGLAWSLSGRRRKTGSAT